MPVHEAPTACISRSCSSSSNTPTYTSAFGQHWERKQNSSLMQLQSPSLLSREKTNLFQENLFTTFPVSTLFDLNFSFPSSQLSILPVFYLFFPFSSTYSSACQFIFLFLLGPGPLTLFVDLPPSFLCVWICPHFSACLCVRTCVCILLKLSVSYGLPLVTTFSSNRSG